MASTRAVIAEKVQACLNRADWEAAIDEWEKLFLVDDDPLIRVRIGDLQRRLGRPSYAVREYVHAAELFLMKGFVRKALAQYGLVLRIDAANADALFRREMLRAMPPSSGLKREPVEYRASEDWEPAMLMTLVGRSPAEPSSVGES